MPKDILIGLIIFLVPDRHAAQKVLIVNTQVGRKLKAYRYAIPAVDLNNGGREVEQPLLTECR